MKSIWNFPLSIKAFQRVFVPRYARFLSAQMQGEHPCLWYIVDTNEQEKERLTIQIVGTGRELPANCDKSNHLATVQGDGFVWHLFETERAFVS